MGWRCAIQIKGLTIGEPKSGQKHRMPLMKAAKEVGYERASRSVTLDRGRSDKNIYSGYKSGEECAKMMEEEAAFVEIKMKDGTFRKRKNRADAVVGFAVIFNPPADVCKDWSDGQYDKEASELLEEVEQLHGEAASEKEEVKQLHREAFVEKKQAIKRGVIIHDSKKHFGKQKKQGVIRSKPAAAIHKTM